MRLTSVDGQKDLPRWFETFFAIAGEIKTGSFEVTLPDGRVFFVEGPSGGPAGRLTVHNADFFTRLVREGDLGFSEMYLDGWWETPDLQALLDVILLNNDTLGRGFPAMVLVRAYERLRHWLRSNTRRGARRNISYHYDLGNAFYERWLDPSMTYSSALFTGQGEDLTQAQANKYAAICDRIGVKSGDHLLEIGCGWGGFAEYAIRERGVRVTGLTLSREQHDYAARRLFEAGLAERAEIVIRDYRDERGVYDGIASIEMFEAVGERYWPAYFETIRERLRPGAIAGLQIITIADGLFAEYRRQTDFIQKYIFPGGMLPSPGALRAEAERAGLALLGSVEFGESYSRTLREWRDRFQSQWDEICALGFDDRFRRMWNFYLASCAACFRAKTTDVTQISLQKPA
ncbi:class I SAM-dependent methyltransferase [Limibaculum sp. M0105]|uniref:Class I SAM-dependent methyltransferase n=1 Tax=Thermohalobaculum xanthum TaxID=2753746 RepID=A0A8J7M5H2_9RHOB|nr:cyclopropane-fatty-acyl-phospholipid synthase family protein [Thermohalobaculum xanthum]MBK0398861.1 class I SAM-dependent methyltransferase [Thermohalobaculum xanthum]